MKQKRDDAEWDRGESEREETETRERRNNDPNTAE